MKIKLRRLAHALLLISLTGAGWTTARAQEASARTTLAQEESAPALYVFKVAHDHRIGKGLGELRITASGIEYRGESADEQLHNRVWRDDEIKRLELTKTTLHIVAYEAARIPLVPRHTPKVRGGQALRLGTERDHEFRLREGEITPDVVSTLLARFQRPVGTTVLPQEDAESGKLLFELPVFHRHLAGGESGLLRVFADRVIFAAGENAHYWRYPDIRDIGKLGRYKFEIATYEGQTGTDGKSYIFDLKRPMTDDEYDQLWARVYESGRSPRLRPVQRAN